MSRRSQQIDVHFQQARRLHHGGRLAEAQHVYHQILAVAPDHADAAHGLAVLALQANQPEVALPWLDRAIANRPAVALYHLHRAHALLGLRRFDAAIEACRAALRLKRNYAEAHQALGHALSDSGRSDEALSAYREALRINPNLPDIHNNLGAALRSANRLEEALSRLREAQRRTPRDTGVLANLSSVLKELGQFDAAGSCLRDALRLSPADPVLLYNLGLLSLLLGRFAEGWAGFEHRFRAGAVAPRTFAHPEWQGEQLSGRRLLVFAEQGLGDMIQFCRYLPLVAGDVVFEVPGRMIRLLGTLPGAPPMVAAGGALPPFDLVCPLMSLPHRLGRPDDMAAAVPYLSAEPDRIAQWRERLGPGGFKVGISWQGNPNRYEDKGRSVPLQWFRPLAAVPGVRLISLQRGFGSEQAGSIPALEDWSEVLDAGPDAFIDTAAIMTGLDLIISSDTAMVHLAGALGRPVWVPLRFVPDWRWMLERLDSPWYPTMRLFRQRERDDWTSVFEEITGNLERLARQGAPTG